VPTADRRPRATSGDGRRSGAEAGPGKPSIREVARRAGVAISSVSRVLSGHPDVSPEMRKAVLAAVDELGYRPNVLAQSLRRRRSMSVGFAVSDIANPIFAEIVTGAERRLRNAGYSMLLTNSEGSSSLDADNVRLLEQRQVDGLLLSLAHEDREETARLLRASDLPMVLVDRDRPAGVNAMSARFDHRVGMIAATEHLLALGHRDVALIVGGPALPSRERRAAVEETLWSGGGRCIVLEGDFGIEEGYRGAIAAIARTPRPTALVAAGNTLMAGALRALRDHGLRVGADISFVGCDNVPIAELHEPAIAVVVRDTRALGQAAADLLLGQLDGSEEGPDEVVLPTSFLARPSCAPPA
jgi:LacI family transcriptional regulator